MSDMNVGSVSGVYSAINTTISGSVDAANSSNGAAAAGDVAAVYEKSAVEEKKATYSSAVNLRSP